MGCWQTDGLPPYGSRVQAGHFPSLERENSRPENKNPPELRVCFCFCRIPETLLFDSDDFTTAMMNGCPAKAFTRAGPVLGGQAKTDRNICTLPNGYREAEVSVYFKVGHSSGAVPSVGRPWPGDKKNSADTRLGRRLSISDGAVADGQLSCVVIFVSESGDCLKFMSSTSLLVSSARATPSNGASPRKT